MFSTINPEDSNSHGVVLREKGSDNNGPKDSKDQASSGEDEEEGNEDSIEINIDGAAKPRKAKRKD